MTKHRRVAIEQAFIIMGIPKLPKMKPFRWDKRKYPRWARKGRKA